MTDNKRHTPDDPANDTGAGPGKEARRESARPDGAPEDPANDRAAGDPPDGAPPDGGGPAPETEGGSGDDTDPAARIAALEEELAATKENALRAMADAENARKRAERQVAEANKYGAVGLARDMLTISDNLRRALEAAPAEAAEGNEQLANLRTGVEMTEKELQSALQRHNVTEITPRPGDKFDPNLHQAMFEMPTNEHPPGTIAQVMQAGYMLHDRLVRAAMVGVAKAPPADQGGESDRSETGGTGGTDGDDAGGGENAKDGGARS